jgi:hypothetical protein
MISQLSSRAGRIVSDASNEGYFSAASGWEIAIKARVGRLSIGSRDTENSLMRVLPSLPSTRELFMGLPPNHARMKIQSLPLTRGRLGGGRLLRLLFSQQDQEGCCLLLC